MMSKTITGPSEAPSTWLDVQWISRHVPLHETPSASKSPTPSIASLNAELNEIKNQFMPAATSCADAINRHNEQNGSNERTNASYEFRRARSMCNQYEALGAPSYDHGRARGKKRGRSFTRNDNSGVNQFVNRSALKLANIDAILGFILVNHQSTLTAAKASDTKSEDTLGDHFSFVDLCGAPGGFSEYVLYRREHPATSTLNEINDNETNSSTKDCCFDPLSSSNNNRCSIPCFGFGMSLLGSNEDGKGASWNLTHLERYHKSNKKRRKAKHSTSQDTNRHLHYSVCKGSDGTGSIYNWENVLHLQQDILSTLKKNNIDHGSIGLAHLVVADGGFDAQRDSDSQETLATRIIVSQTAAALHLLRAGGNYVIKMFGFEIERTKRMMAFLYNRFHELVLIKPIVSRPASAERYLVCLGFVGPDENWDGLAWINTMMEESVNSSNLLAETSDQLSKLNEKLHSFDAEMLQLNIDSCRSILRHLNEKESSHRDGSRITTVHNGNLDLNRYGQTWQLY